MKATISGVAFSAAKIRSPSFSRSSSSMTTTALPAAMSATARSTESNLVIVATLLSEPAHTRSHVLTSSMNHRAAPVIATAYSVGQFTQLRAGSHVAAVCFLLRRFLLSDPTNTGFGARDHELTRRIPVNAVCTRRSTYPAATP